MPDQIRHDGQKLKGVNIQAVFTTTAQNMSEMFQPVIGEKISHLIADKVMPLRVKKGDPDYITPVFCYDGVFICAMPGIFIDVMRY